MSYSFVERFNAFDKMSFKKKVNTLSNEITKMDPEVKTRWLTALRSGEYKQGPSYLCYGDEYCCLGVLAKTENTETVALEPGSLIMKFVFGDKTFDSMLPEDAFGLSMAVQGILAAFNDHYEMTFEEIATVVEDLL